MIVNNYVKDLQKLYKGKERVKNILTFEFSCDDSLIGLMELFKKGYWSVMPFSFNSYNNFCVKLDPKRKINDSSIVQINDSDGVTVAANLKTFLPLVSIDYLNDLEITEEHFKAKRKEIEEMSLPFREYVDGLDGLDFFYEYICNVDKLELLEKGEESFSQIYLDFWNHYNDTPEQKVYSSLMNKLKNDKNFYPEFEELDYGLWNNRMYGALCHRSYLKLDEDFENVEKYIWKNLKSMHGFDALQLDFGIVPNISSDSSSSILSIIRKLDPDPTLNRKFSKEILDHPLYDALQELRIKKRGYTGERHIEAAAILDTKYNDPYGAWDALVTASYWAGQAGSSAIEPMWEAAIYLSEKYNWSDINEVLIQQYEFYNFYKDKV